LGFSIRNNTATLAPEVAAYSGLDVLSHAIESYTALPFHQRPRPERPDSFDQPIKARIDQRRLVVAGTRMVAQHLPRVFDDPQDEVSRSQMMLAAAYAGIGLATRVYIYRMHVVSRLSGVMVPQFRPSAMS